MWNSDIHFFTNMLGKHIKFIEVKINNMAMVTELTTEDFDCKSIGFI